MVAICTIRLINKTNIAAGVAQIVTAFFRLSSSIKMLNAAFAAILSVTGSTAMLLLLSKRAASTTQDKLFFIAVAGIDFDIRDENLLLNDCW